jgi:hypothetical protein
MPWLFWWRLREPHYSRTARVGWGLWGLYCLVSVILGGMQGDQSALARGDSQSLRAGSIASTASSVAEAPALKIDPVIDVDAFTLWRDYDANEVAADNAYRRKRLAVTGVVDSIEKTVFDTAYLQLRAPNPYQSTTAHMERRSLEQVAALSKGMRVTLLCTGNGRTLGSPSLADCTFK